MFAQILLKSSYQNEGRLVRTITCQFFSLTLTVRGVSNKHCLLTFFISSETTRPFELKFHMKSPYDRLAKIHTNCTGHMSKMATMPIYGKNPLNIFYSGTKRPMALGLGM